MDARLEHDAGLHVQFHSYVKRIRAKLTADRFLIRQQISDLNI